MMPMKIINRKFSTYMRKSLYEIDYNALNDCMFLNHRNLRHRLKYNTATKERPGKRKTEHEIRKVEEPGRCPPLVLLAKEGEQQKGVLVNYQWYIVPPQGPHFLQ